jgi:microcystin-dependent protein
MSDPYIGEIRMFGGNFAPNGWLFCQGQLLAIAEYDTLFNLIGTTYGGDGQNTFAVPDLQSRIPLHQGSGYPWAQTGGLEAVTLSTPQLPVHTHAATASNPPGTSTSPAGAVWSGSSKPAYSTATPTAAMSGAALAQAGGNQPHENMPPFLVINFIISCFGIYPSPA